MEHVHHVGRVPFAVFHVGERLFHPRGEQHVLQAWLHHVGEAFAFRGGVELTALAFHEFGAHEFFDGVRAGGWRADAAGM